MGCARKQRSCRDVVVHAGKMIRQIRFVALHFIWVRVSRKNRIESIDIFRPQGRQKRESITMLFRFFGLSHLLSIHFNKERGCFDGSGFSRKYPNYVAGNGKWMANDAENKNCLVCRYYKYEVLLFINTWSTASFFLLEDGNS